MTERDIQPGKANDLVMPIAFRSPVPTDADWQAQKNGIKLCRGAACYAALAAHFGTDSQAPLEWRVDHRRPYGADNDEVDKSNSNKYLRWRQGKTLPSDGSVQQVYERSGGGVRLDFWRDLPLWELLQRMPLPIPRLHALLESAPTGIRRILFADAAPSETGRYAHAMLEGSELRAIRNLRSLDAFMALLCLSRKGEILDDDVYQYLPAACAYDIFPRVLYSYPPLRCEWETLFACLERIFWRRVYSNHGYFEFPIETIRSSLQRLDDDPPAHLPRKSGNRLRVVDSDPLKALEDRLARTKSVT